MTKGILAAVLLAAPLSAAPVPKDWPEPWTELPPLAFKGGTVSSVAFSPDGMKFAVGCGRTVTVLDAKKWKEVEPKFSDEGNWRLTAMGLAFTPSSATLAYTSRLGYRTLSIAKDLSMGGYIDPAGFDAHRVLIGTEQVSEKFRLFRVIVTDGQQLTTFCAGEWHTAIHTRVGAKADRHKPCVLTWVPVRDAVLLHSAGQPKPPGASDFDILYWLPNYDSEEPKFDNGQRLSGHKARPSASGAAGDGTRLVTGDDGGEVIVWKPKLANKDVWEIGHRLTFAGGPFHTAQVVSLAVSPDAKRVAALVVGAPKKDEPKTAVRRVYVWNTDAKQLPEPLWESKPEPASDCLGTVAFSVDGKTLAAAVASEADRKAKKPTGTVRRWQLGPKPAEPEPKK